jgi:hypothetical protein
MWRSEDGKHIKEINRKTKREGDGRQSRELSMFANCRQNRRIS